MSIKTNKQKILDIYKDTGTGFRESELIAKTGLSDNEFFMAIESLREEELVRQMMICEPDSGDPICSGFFITQEGLESK